MRRQNSRNKFTTSASTTTTTAAPQVSEGEENNASELEVSEPTSTTARAVGYVLTYGQFIIIGNNNLTRVSCAIIEAD